jgi:hypothetical protein
MIGDKSFWSNGYGPTPMQTVRFAFEQMNLHKVALGVFEFNERARLLSQVRVRRRRPFPEEYFQDGRYWDVIRMSVLRAEWEALKPQRRPWPLVARRHPGPTKISGPIRCLPYCGTFVNLPLLTTTPVPCAHCLTLQRLAPVPFPFEIRSFPLP